MAVSQRHLWPERSHEQKVERFYGWGVENYGDFHGGYLNFGLLEERAVDYLGAAENMVRRMGTLLGLDGESRLLDVGCGMGSQDIHLLRNFAPLSIDGIDGTWPHVEHARRAARPGSASITGRPPASLSPARVSRTSLSIEAPEHFDTREDCLREAYRVLTPGEMGLMEYVFVRAEKPAASR